MSNTSIAAFASEENFSAAQRMAKALASSSLVPKDYQGNIANCVIAMELANRIGASVWAIMQNMHVIHGRPAFGASFIIASVNSAKHWTPIRFETEGGDARDKGFRCRAVSTDKHTDQRCEGSWITWDMVNAEGWASKSGSKWKTMPEQMFRYRAASFWARVYAPELMMGMQTADEVEDIATHEERRGSVAVLASGGPKALSHALDAIVEAAVEEAPEPQPVAADYESAAEDLLDGSDVDAEVKPRVRQEAVDLVAQGHAPNLVDAMQMLLDTKYGG